MFDNTARHASLAGGAIQIRQTPVFDQRAINAGTDETPTPAATRYRDESPIPSHESTPNCGPSWPSTPRKMASSLPAANHRSPVTHRPIPTSYWWLRLRSQIDYRSAKAETEPSTEVRPSAIAATRHSPRPVDNRPIPIPIPPDPSTDFEPVAIARPRTHGGLHSWLPIDGGRGNRAQAAKATKAVDPGSASRSAAVSSAVSSSRQSEIRSELNESVVSSSRYQRSIVCAVDSLNSRQFNSHHSGDCSELPNSLTNRRFRDRDFWCLEFLVFILRNLHCPEDGPRFDALKAWPIYESAILSPGTKPESLVAGRKPSLLLPSLTRIFRYQR